ncbi:uncharacterized protein C8Q71DRAFT_843674 [Rhodofomes roseus]|uniref:BTB domain-containing protein n=1 Tax=Rhodofomes roseus TaxID=34475 RepID=A0ABQ8JZP7_9APHY|nr:uncharacterized protein C8Q71DRAFT_843674 [Rhodofomes roseus]KAH9829579.1 hypothetical protein C8Q71DRAFT_843674 [Rhodofomes roseus]
MSSSSSGADTKTSQSSRKRPRTEPDSVDDANESFRRDETYWYDDGNIIFVAQNVGFRVYKGILAAKCEVFRNMFSLPQPAQDSGPGGSRDTVLYGCPVVHVTDTAGEFRMLLDSLLNGMEIIRGGGCRFDDVANAVRVAHKYDVRQLYADSMKRLQECYPTKLNDWDDLGSFSPLRFGSTDDEDEVDARGTQAIVAVTLARLTETHSLLPAALYECCQLDSRVLIKGRIRPDGTAITLSPEDLAQCIDAKANLCSRVSEVDYQLFDITPSAASAASHPRCDDIFKQVCDRAFVEVNGARGRCDVLRRRKSMITQLVHDMGLCRLCLMLLRGRSARLRGESWGLLPKLVGVDDLPNWGEGH